jgi:uncharacterized protein (DUF488 family)
LTRGTLYSIGHGSRTTEDFLSLLQDHGIECLVDVRAYPRSKRHPQFSRLVLEASLARSGIRYLWEGGPLGGMRRPGRDSRHSGLHDAAFRGYADHMESAEFAQALERLANLGDERKVAFMCAEVMPQYCHRSFIADALVAGGAQVWHLVGVADTRSHALNPVVRRDDLGLVYDVGEQLALGF